MIRALYRALLRGPKFRGRHRLENALRRLLAPAVDAAPEGLRMQLDAQEWLQISLLAGEEQEPRTIALQKRLLRPGDVSIDVGAHVGFHALVAARCVGPTGQVIAVEPQPYNADRVLTNSALNGLENIVVVVAAAGAAPGSIELNNQKPSDKARLTALGAGVSDLPARFEVPLITLDQLAQRRGLTGVRLLKIDVEGYEAEVLAGAAQMLRVTDHVIFEWLPDSDPAERSRIVEALSGAGFALRQVDGTPWAPGAEAIEHNIWACRQD